MYRLTLKKSVRILLLLTCHLYVTGLMAAFDVNQISIPDSSVQYNNWASKLIPTDPQLAQIYAEKALEFATKNDNLEENIRAILSIGSIAYDRLKYNEAKNYFEEALSMSSHENVYPLRVEALLKLVRWHKYRSKDYALAEEYTHQCLEVSKSYDFTLGIAKSYVRLADLKAQQRQVGAALNYLFLSQEHYIKLNLEGDIAHHYNQVGKQIWKYNSSKAIEVYRKGLEFSDNYPDLKLSMGIAYQQIGKAKEAYGYFVSALKTYQTEDALRNKGIALSYLGESLVSLLQYEKADSIANLSIELLTPVSPRQQSGLPGAYRVKGKVNTYRGLYDEALLYYDKSVILSKRLEEYDELAESHFLIGDLHLKHLNKPEKAIISCTLSKQLSEEYNLINKEKYSCECLYESYKQTENYQRAFDFYREYSDLKDSTDLIEFKQSIDSLSSFFIAKNDLALKNQELKSQNRMNKGLGVLVLIGLSFIAFLYTSIRRLSEKNEIIKNQKQEIENKSKHLAELNATKTKILAVIGHDIKGPVRTLRSFLDLLIGERLTKESFMDIAGNLRNNTTAVFETLENLLNWAKLEIDGTMPETGRVNVHSEFLKVKSLLQPAIDQKNINFSADIPDNLSLMSTEEGINIILRNLISNAIKFTEANGTIKVTAHKSADQGIISVYDDGVGIEEYQMQGLFENIQTTYGTNNEKGTGIGLNLCKSIIDQLGGHIQVENNSDKGSCFSFALPIA